MMSVKEGLFFSTYNINKRNIKLLAENAKDFAISKGIAMRSSDVTLDTRVPIPFCLAPSVFPEKYFSFASSIQTDINYMIHQVAHSEKFLKNCLSRTIDADPFTAQIWKIFETVCNEGIAQPLSLGIVRSDYMLDTDKIGRIVDLKQIENNTISSSFGGVSPSVTELHRFLLDRAGVKDFFSKLPKNESLLNIAKGIISAWSAYGKKSAVVLFVVEEITLNICDQRALEYAIWNYERDIEVLRHTFTELHHNSHLKDHCLYVNGKEVAIVYYRCGYVPEHYSSEDWAIRLMLERSRAIKCPTAGYHLAGTKRVQFQLSLPGVVEQFLPDEQVSKCVRKVFAAQYALDMNEDGNKAAQMAMENPQNYVMKPEREGGGNNVYGNDIKCLLEDIGSSEVRQAYILMQKINPPVNPNCVIQRDKEPLVMDVISELGIFGVILGTKEKILENYMAGHLLRSKSVNQDEGGIAAGFGALDSPYLS